MANATVQIQLSALGIALAAGSPLFIANGTGEFRFVAGEPLEVDADEWQWLATHTVEGKMIFELAPVASPPIARPVAVAKTAAVPAPVATVSPETPVSSESKE